MTRHILVLMVVATLSGCGADAPPGTNPVATNSAAPAKPAVEPVAPAPAAAKPLATATTDWPGVEARLTTARRNAGLLLVEVQLANIGSSPVTIDKYSVASATIAYDVSESPTGVFSTPSGQPAATSDLTQTLAPGETTTVNATFQVPGNAQAATISMPKMGLFERILIGRPGGAHGADGDTRGKEKADNRARAMRAGRKKAG